MQEELSSRIQGNTGLVIDIQWSCWVWRIPFRNPAWKQILKTAVAIIEVKCWVCSMLNNVKVDTVSDWKS